MIEICKRASGNCKNCRDSIYFKRSYDSKRRQKGSGSRGAGNYCIQSWRTRAGSMPGNPVEVLPSIVEAVGGRMKIFVDGGIRSGIDVFKALAMGADAVLAARPFATAVYGGSEEGAKALVDKFGTELVDTMKMCGAYSLEEISKDMIWKP